jgi:thiosulfate sulfurtransferase
VLGGHDAGAAGATAVHGHVPGAVQLNDGNVQEFLQNTAKEQPVVVYCYHGNSSLGATAFLMENGFTNVASMSGGFEAWRPVYEHEPA